MTRVQTSIMTLMLAIPAEYRLGLMDRLPPKKEDILEVLTAEINQVFAPMRVLDWKINDWKSMNVTAVLEFTNDVDMLVGKLTWGPDFKLLPDTDAGHPRGEAEWSSSESTPLLQADTPPASRVCT